MTMMSRSHIVPIEQTLHASPAKAGVELRAARNWAPACAGEADLFGEVITSSPPSFRHPGLEPGSRFFGVGQGSGTPGQARGDGLGLGKVAKLFSRHSREGGNDASATRLVGREGSWTPAFAGVTVHVGRGR